MRSVLILSLFALMVTALPARAESGDEGGDSAVTHPAPYPHIHPRRRVVRVVPAPPPPPRSDRASVYFGIGGLGNFFIEGEDELSKIYRGGGGVDLTLGLRLNEMIAFELGWLASFQSTSQETVYGEEIREGSVQSIYFNGKIFVVPSSARIEPFLHIGMGVYMLSESLRAELTGFGFQLGGGVDIRFSDSIALGLKLVYHGFYVDNSERSYYNVPTESAFLNTIMAEANLQFHF